MDMAQKPQVRWAADHRKSLSFSRAASLVASSIASTDGRTELDLQRSRSELSAITLGQDEWWEERSQDHCGSSCVFYEVSPFRIWWNLIVTVLLIYTGTIFLYRVCFVEFHIPDPIVSSGDGFWHVLDSGMTMLFLIDLVLNFFFTYRTDHGVEVDSLRLIARQYLAGFFIINLLACAPERLIREVFTELTGTLQPDDSAVGHSAATVRMARLGRISRLTRLTRLARMAKFASFKPRGPMLRWLQHLRGIRVLKNTFGLLWVVHLLACGWYLCAALHDDSSETWVGRRSVDTEGEVSLLSAQPLDQWMHSFYFILTVFTTVGFGDMSAVTSGEIVFVCITMMIGAVVHSIVISEVISIVMSVDKTQEFASKQTELVEAFAEHTELDESSERLMSAWVSFSAKGWETTRYDREQMKQLITDKCMPRSLLEKLPLSLFGGRLVQNRFLLVRGGRLHMPPRLPLLLALAVQKSSFQAGEIVYQMHDFACTTFLVLTGTFAHVARPTPQGGHEEKPQESCDDAVCATETMASCASARSHKNADSTPASRGTRFSRPLPRQCTIQIVQEGPKTQHLYPYSLYSGGSYFGLAEVYGGRERISTVRCESDGGGEVLALQKHDFARLLEEFPAFATAWSAQARRREAHRLRQLQRLTIGMTHRRLAATRIQQAFRAHLLESPRRFEEEAASAPTPREAAARSPALARAPATLGRLQGGLDGEADDTATLLRHLAAASDGHARDVRDLRAGLDAMRADFAALRGDLHAVLGAVAGKATSADRPQQPALQSSAYAGASEQVSRTPSQASVHMGRL